MENKTIESDLVREARLGAEQRRAMREAGSKFTSAEPLSVMPDSKTTATRLNQSDLKNRDILKNGIKGKTSI